MSEDHLLTFILLSDKLPQNVDPLESHPNFQHLMSVLEHSKQRMFIHTVVAEMEKEKSSQNRKNAQRMDLLRWGRPSLSFYGGPLTKAFTQFSLFLVWHNAVDVE